MAARVWLIGGTQESSELAHRIAHEHLPCTVSVATEAAKFLYPVAPEVLVWVGRLNAESTPLFLKEQQISAILDASHPFATEISQLAIAAAAKRQIPYLRYERPIFTAQSDPNTSLTTAQDIHLENFDTLLSGGYLTGHRVLFAIGYRTLELFSPWQTRTTLFARILPSTTALNAAIAAGFTPDRLIAIRPPISLELERSLWKQWQISMVITKASGTPGGEVIKRQVAAELNTTLVTIARPPMVYPEQTSDLAIALAFCQKHVAQGAGLRLNQ